MLFNSNAFIFGFLPVCLLVFQALGRLGTAVAIAVLLVASLAFYGLQDSDHLWLLAASIVFNYAVAAAMLAGRGTAIHARLWLIIGLAGNLAAIGYYKYGAFIAANAMLLAGLPPIGWHVVLPVGISFFTFTQIAFLVDAYRGKVVRHGFMEYALFVSYFPHLVAGPILHHAETIPQFLRPSFARLNARNVAVGLAVFALGLAKKVLLADDLAPSANAVFAAHGPVGMADAWIGALSFTFQIYFDFSGYSDMAIGLSRLFNVDLPLNFYSPYKASSIIEFWRCWHMTLSRFLRDYLYIPLGGNRRGEARRYLNIMITMALGGVWHGAAWTFVVWGMLHGVYLLINHAFRSAVPWRRFGDAAHRSGVGAFLGWALTFLGVVVAWVFFRADTLQSALAVLAGMAGRNGLSLESPLAGDDWQPVGWIAVGAAIAWLLPNSQQIFALPFTPGIVDGVPAAPAPGAPAPAAPETPARAFLLRMLTFRPTTAQAFAYALMTAASILLLRRATPFLYFQF
jgi:D-alanyl-lipoteichoic acid acyltransferase DltB (MBOAT superfamily)